MANFLGVVRDACACVEVDNVGSRLQDLVHLASDIAIVYYRANTDVRVFILDVTEEDAYVDREK